MPARYDLVIRGGVLADGTGGPLVESDIAVENGRIAALGRITASGAEEIDAKGKLVTPGFVDIHTHYDGQATWDDRLTPSSWHGVTTAVMGNCGVGFAPVRRADHDRLIELMEGVEDIPGVTLHEGLAWNWESFGDYLDAVARQPRDIDICAQLPHGALRVYVMGERGARLEPATAEDIAQMRVLSAQAMRVGAIGFSTSRTLNHRTVKGDPTPSLRASEAELLGIAQGLADAGRGVIELISDFNTPDLAGEFAMIRRLVEQTGRPLSLSLAQVPAAPQGWRNILGLIERASQDGLPIKGQVAPRALGALLGLQSTLNPFSAHTAFKTIDKKPLAEKLAILRDPSFREKLLAEGAPRETHPFARGISQFDRIFPLGAPLDYEPSREQSIAAIAARMGKPAAELAYDLLLQDEGRNFLYYPFFNYIDGSLDVCREMMAHPDTLMGLGDGGAHVGLICDASYASFLLSHWGRDRAAGRFDLGWLVKRHTSDNARAVGLHDRGIVAAGMKADLNVIDFDRLALERPFMAFDLPAGGKRLLQKARGFDATIVSGTVAYRDGEAMRALPGKLVRGPQPAPHAP